MKNLIIFSMLTVMAIMNFSGCGKAQERPAMANKNIADKAVAIDSLTDITKAERQDSPENILFKQSLINKMDESKRDHALLLLAQNRLVFMLMEGKVVVLEYIPAAVNKHATVVSSTAEIATSASDTATVSSTLVIPSNSKQVGPAQTLHTYESLMAYKDGRTKEMTSLKTSVESQHRFVILSEIAMQTGILSNELTEYNEKKSTLSLTETPLAQAQVLILQSEIKTPSTATTDVFGVE